MTTYCVPDSITPRPIKPGVATVETIEAIMADGPCAILPVAGDCLEGVDVVDGGWVAVDFTRRPAPPRYRSKGGDGSSDLCLCYATFPGAPGPTLADEMDSDLVETTAHSGARPSHARWQGQVFSRSGKSKKVPDFRRATGYGTGPGLGGWNCRHSFHPYFEGMASTYGAKELKKLEAKSITYNGEKLTEYEASQRQRYIERQIRRWKREQQAMKAAGQPQEEARAKLKEWRALQTDLVEQTGLKRQYDRERAGG